MKRKKQPDQMEQMRALRALHDSTLPNRERDVYAFLSIMHPQMSHAKKREISANPHETK